VRRAADASVVKLSPMCFVEPYNYTEQYITDDMLRQFDDYLRDLTTQTSFTVMVLPLIALLGLLYRLGLIALRALCPLPPSLLISEHFTVRCI